MSEHSVQRVEEPTVERLKLPHSAPPANHGKTLAAWTTVAIELVGFTIAGLAMVFAVVWLCILGLVICAVGIVVGLVMRGMGHGQGGAATRERDARVVHH